jgi:subtilisin-like proprotein convertase family protein
MKKTILILALILSVFAGKVNAQQPIQLDSTADFGKWSAWIKDTVKGDDGSLYTWEYRYTASKRKGIAVYYDFEIRNTGTTKISGRINFTYTTLWLSTPMSESESFKVKPGETTTVSYIQQGCKKTDKKKADYSSCLDCPINYTFYISTK